MFKKSKKQNEGNELAQRISGRVAIWSSFRGAEITSINPLTIRLTFRPSENDQCYIHLRAPAIEAGGGFDIAGDIERDSDKSFQFMDEMLAHLNKSHKG